MAGGPVIGITTSYDDGDEGALVPGRELLLVDPAYARAVAAAGGVPVLLPLWDPGAAPGLLEHLDGLLVTGNDRPLARRLAEQLDRITLREQSPLRYDSDAAWIGQALERGLPLLGVCRGMQTLNAVLGGSVELLASAPAGQTMHGLAVTPGSALARVLGVTATQVNSFHRQGVERPGAGVTFSGFAPGGSVEALEVADRPFCLGLQFHPERLVASQPEMRRVFAAFIGAAGVWRGARRGQGAGSAGDSAATSLSIST